MQEEVECFVNHIDSLVTVEKAHLTFSSGRLNNKDVVVVMSGIGKVNAAISTQIMIDFFEIDGIICTGVAGGLDPRLAIGDVVVSEDLVQYDVDVSAFGYSPGHIPRLNIKNFLADARMVKKTLKIGKTLLRDNSVFVGRILSGDTFVSNPDFKTKLRTAFGGSCAEMEGAAIAQVCHLNKVPFVVIRSISDKADGVAAYDYKGFVEKAISNAFLIVNALVEDLD